MTLPGCETLEDAARNANLLHILALVSLVLMTLGEIGAALYGHRVEALKEEAHALELSSLKKAAAGQEAMAAQEKAGSEKERHAEERGGMDVQRAVYWPGAKSGDSTSSLQMTLSGSVKEGDGDGGFGNRAGRAAWWL